MQILTPLGMNLIKAGVLDRTAAMQERDYSTAGDTGEAPGPTRFEATVVKVQWRLCWSFAIEVEANEFATLEPGQALLAHLGWFLVSSTRLGKTTVRFRGFGRPKLTVGERIVVEAEPVSRPRKTAQARSPSA